jgi:4-amino-4-deoxy-L-arabinose transferase-like glycosyltransferase
MNAGRLRVNWWIAFMLLFVAKAVIAARLPLFTDEAFYAWEGQRPAWAYSDLPGLTAWLARLGAGLHDLLGVPGLLALRTPFLLLGALAPLLAGRIGARWFGARAGVQAAWLALLMPLSGLLGVLAVPDVPLVVAGLCCVEGWSRLRERVDGAGLALLALGLVAGALAHYRFAPMLLAAGAGVALDARSRALLRAPMVLAVLALGALAWWPLLQWNLAHAAAGIDFQVRERNPWAFDARGAAWLPIQWLVVTPALFVLLAATWVHAWSRRRDASAPWALVAGLAGIAVGAYFVLGFFTDRERVSFHWPLFGWLVLCAAAPPVLARWRASARLAVWALAGVGLFAATAFLAASASPRARLALAAGPLYPNDFGGADELRRWVRASVVAGAAPTTWLAGDFATAAQLAFALGRADIRVLDAAANHKHGRAAQLQAWGLVAGPDWLRTAGAGEGGRVALVVEDSATPLKHRLEAYHALCAQLGWLPVPQALSVDHGRKRFLRYDFGGPAGVSGAHAACATPALAWIDAPVANARVAGVVEVRGWAFKDGVGLRGVDVLVDATATPAAYGAAMPGVRDYWRISDDPNQPRVGFSARVDVSGLAPGRHWLGLRLHGADGSVEAWPAQAIVVTP